MTPVIEPADRGAPPLEELVAFVCTDLGGISRGRARPLRDLQAALQTGVGWVPISQTIGPFDHIPNCPLWGAHGDRRLMPDRQSEVRVDFGLGASPVHFYLCDITHTDGTAWDVCARTYLKQALAMLRSRTGCELRAAFEHEFTFIDAGADAGPGFSLRRLRAEERFGTLYMTALQQAMQEPETFLPEFGSRQFEVTCRPAMGVCAADRSVTMRELAYETARQLQRRVSFSPICTPEGLGNGLHIHFSLIDEAGRSRMYDASKPGRLSTLAAQFAAGVLKYLPAITAFTAPSVLSYHRLLPHRWAAAFTCLGDRNREAALRICPTIELPGMAPDEQLHLEFRAADSTANPYLALAMLVQAGLQGVEEGLEASPLHNSDPVELSDAQREALGIRRLPESAEAALNLMLASPVVTSWCSEAMLGSYEVLRRAEIEAFAGKSVSELVPLYNSAF